MKRLLLTATLILSQQAFAMNYFKWIATALASAGLVQAGMRTDKCNQRCDFDPLFYDPFQDYLEGLTSCEKVMLQPFMDERVDFIAEADEVLSKEMKSIASIADAHSKIKKMKRLIKEEIRLFTEELKECQKLLFDECTSEESQSILAKHVQVILHAIELRNEQIDQLNDLD